MKKNATIILILVLTLSPKIIHAQWPECVDITRVQPLYQCNQEAFDPICGCDGNTYRNLCTAYNNYGINYWSGGVCQGFFLDFYPDPITNLDPMNLNIQFEDNVVSSLNVRVIDYFGHLVYQQLYNGVNKIQTQIDLNLVKQGMYIIIVESGQGQYWAEKFLRL
ncbi:MAG: T9SS type A sorting domain-containing protein [Bacteroidetes bacterium]|nr:T9SS type A sorting domain-containing protein [Bacteroidota bacterium]